MNRGQYVVYPSFPEHTPKMVDCAQMSPVACAAALLTLARERASEDLTRTYSRICGMIAAYGAARDVVLAMRSGELPVPLAPESLFVAEFVDAAVAAAAQLVEGWSAAGLQAHAIATVTYPRQLEEIVDAPPIVFHHGAHEAIHTFGLAVVGTRKASPDGLKRARRAATALAENGITVVSGMALGIDTAAHEATIAAGGVTVAVMGTPITKRYPRENAALADAIVAAGGALVTEYPPTWTTQRWDFLRRNRTMSGIAAATLVIEASETSGAKSQAVAAVQHGRLVFLPSSLVQAHRWAHALVTDGVNGVRAIEIKDIDTLIAMIVPGAGQDVELAVI
ncbi:MAG: DNA-processing protein DprA [Gemmatimonadaceae bacterium]|nr:DNA-processing protein DprA [Gemmatimonadaceae bacterium]